MRQIKGKAELFEVLDDIERDLREAIRNYDNYEIARSRGQLTGRIAVYGKERSYITSTAVATVRCVTDYYTEKFGGGVFYGVDYYEEAQRPCICIQVIVDEE